MAIMRSEVTFCGKGSVCLTSRRVGSEAARGKCPQRWIGKDAVKATSRDPLSQPVGLVFQLASHGFGLAFEDVEHAVHHGPVYQARQANEPKPGVCKLRVHRKSRPRSTVPVRACCPRGRAAWLLGCLVACRCPQHCTATLQRSDDGAPVPAAASLDATRLVNDRHQVIWPPAAPPLHAPDSRPSGLGRNCRTSKPPRSGLARQAPTMLRLWTQPLQRRVCHAGAPPRRPAPTRRFPRACWPAPASPPAR